MNIKTPSQLYLEGHAGNHVLMRLKGDQIVNHTLNSRLERESAWAAKSSTVCISQQFLDENIQKLFQNLMQQIKENVVATIILFF